MRRDMDLIRSILFELEEMDAMGFIKESQDQERWCHLQLIIEAGLARGKILTASPAGREVTPEGIRGVILYRLTWEGHDFLDAARDDTIWKQATRTVSEKTGSVSFDVLKALLIALTKEAIGL